MERFSYRTLNQAQVLQQDFPLSDSGDDVVYSIYDVDDDAADVTNSAMTYVTGVLWKADWTPTQSNNYQIDFWNRTQDVHFFEYVKVAGAITGVPSGSAVGSTLTVLQKEFLLSIDRYNASDLSGDESAGDRATGALNKALQRIYGFLKDNSYMDSVPDTTSFASVAATDYVDLVSAISDADQITSLTESTNDRKLINIPFWKYREWAPDPSNTTGDPTHYARLFTRIYLYPRPDSAITYTVDYKPFIADLSTGTNKAAIPAKYNYWVYDEARIYWHLMEDPSDVTTYQVLKAQAADSRDIALRDMGGDYDHENVASSHWGDDGPNRLMYDEPGT